MMGFDEVEEINSLVEELGVDAENVHGLMAWAMDLYDNGIITREDLGGIDLKWGDRDATMALLKKIVYKEDSAPAALAEGWWYAIEAFGPESRYYAWCSSANQSIARYEPRSKVHGLPFANGTGHGGGSGLFDAATMCVFASFAFMAIWGPPQEIVRTFTGAAAGWELSHDQIEDIALRIDFFSRCLSMREGFHPDKHAFLPDRAFDEPVTSKYGTTSSWTRLEWEEARKNYYVQSLKLTERGLPPRRELQRLGLEFMIPVLEPLNAVD